MLGGTMEHRSVPLEPLEPPVPIVPIVPALDDARTAVQ
jgi:hypothetical protein